LHSCLLSSCIFGEGGRLARVWCPCRCGEMRRQRERARAKLTCALSHAHAWMHAYGSSPARDEAESGADSSKSDDDEGFRMRLFEIPQDGEPWDELENFDSDDLWSSKVCVCVCCVVCLCACACASIVVCVCVCVWCIGVTLHTRRQCSQRASERASKRGRSSVCACMCVHVRPCGRKRGCGTEVEAFY